MGKVGLSLVVFLLYAKILMVGTYAVTVGSLYVPIFIVATFIANGKNLRYTLELASMALYPILVYLAHVAFRSTYSLGITRFLSSYALWLVSVVVIWCAFQRRSVIRDMRPDKVLWILLALGALQYIGLTFLGTTIGYTLIQPISINNFFEGYTNVLASDATRAVGSYYEPSMFGRVTSTLAMMLLVRDKKPYTFIAYTAMAFIFSSSFSIIILVVTAMVFYAAGMKKSIVGLGIAALLIIAIAWPLLEKRLEVGVGGESDNSTLVRTVLPLFVLKGLLPHYPMGVPIGANASVVGNASSAELLDFREAKITNGVYEFVMYFGFMALVPFTMVVLFIIRCLRRRDTSMALAGSYLILATGASSSFLSIESSLLIAIFIVSMRFKSNNPAWTLSRPSRVKQSWQSQTNPGAIDLSLANKI
ncbi:hypothetical protein SAMN05421770_11525 [Granulicella rosea]|uniref:O-Antigen ligase n=1 Tax=Granulicella rosea TaxID=474952 RepID=A0A239MKR6_9BACT|nr:hypothetical protein [Granulicella rosea]SNT43255.1 hypothetical protein SAMN05421770_11525 [Granulicella rosea]